MAGLYVLLLQLESSTALEIGALGRFELAAGCYLYTGSARRALQARVARHFRKDKAIRWHIDHLTSAPQCRPKGAVVLSEPRVTECQLNQLVAGLGKTSAPLPGFGASDCRASCLAHLWYTRRPIALARAVRELAAAAAAVSWLLPPK